MTNQTIAEYIAERRAVLKTYEDECRKISGVTIIPVPHGAFVSDMESEMPRVLDMLEKAIRTLGVYSRDTFDPSRAIGASVVLQQIAETVNE